MVLFILREGRFFEELEVEGINVMLGSKYLIEIVVKILLRYVILIFVVIVCCVIGVVNCLVWIFLWIGSKYD